MRNACRGLMAIVTMCTAGISLATHDERRTLSFGAHRFDPLLESTGYRPGTETQEGYALRLVQFDRSPDQRALDQLKSVPGVVECVRGGARIGHRGCTVAGRVQP